MTLEQYWQTLKNLNEQIKMLEESRKSLVEENKAYIDKLIEQRQKEDEKWFLNNFDVIWANRYKFMKDSPNADIIIDFFPIYTMGLKHISIITINDLINLWDLGFKYQGYPIVEYTNTRRIHRISYIKNGKVETLKNFAEQELCFSQVLYGILEYMSLHRRLVSIYDEYKTIRAIRDVLVN